jgi:cell division protein FtsB
MFIFTFFIKNFCSTDTRSTNTLAKIQALKAKAEQTNRLNENIKNNIAKTTQNSQFANTATVTNNTNRNENTAKQNTVIPSNTQQNTNLVNISAITPQQNTNTINPSIATPQQQNVVSLSAFQKQQLELLTLKIPAIEEEKNVLQSQNDKLKKENDKLKAEIISLKTENNNLKTENNQIKEKLKNQQNTSQINNTNINNKQNVTQTNNQTNTQKQKSSIKTNKKHNTNKSSWISGAKNAKIKILENRIDNSKDTKECEKIIAEILNNIEKIAQEANKNIASLKQFNELVTKAKNKIELLKNTTNNSNVQNSNNMLPPTLDILGNIGGSGNNNNIEIPPMLDILGNLGSNNNSSQKIEAPPMLDILSNN